LLLDDIQEVLSAASVLAGGLKTIENHLASPGCDEIFTIALTEWTREAAASLVTLQKDLDLRSEAIKELIAKFAEAPTMKSTELFTLLSGFASTLDVRLLCVAFSMTFIPPDHLNLCSNADWRIRNGWRLLQRSP